MDTHEQIKTYIDGLSEPKCSDMRQLHQFMLEIIPNGKLMNHMYSVADGFFIKHFYS